PLFSFDCDRDLQHLHSFPTRRSSDLTGRTGLTAGQKNQAKVAIGTGIGIGHTEINPHTIGHLLMKMTSYVWMSMTPWTTSRKTLDRKSTRLNSSHLVISYAVFCLKKK